MKLLDRYFIKEMFSSFFFGLFAFTMIFMVDLLMELIELIINKGVPLFDVVRLFIFTLPAILVLVFPMTILLATLVALGRLSSDSEIIACLSSGISFKRILVPFLIIGFLFSIITFLMNEFVVPVANEKRQEIFRKITFRRPVPKIAENVFFSGGKSITFFVNKYDIKNNILKNILMFQMFHNKFPLLVNALQTRFLNIEKSSNFIWEFEDGYEYKLPESPEKDLMIMKFKKMKLDIAATYGSYKRYKYRRPAEKSIRELLKDIKQSKQANIPVRELWLELFMKTSLPFACFVFTILGAPLAISTKRGGKSIGMGLSVVIIFAYYLLMSLGKALGRGGILSPFLAAWMQNIIVALSGILMIYKMKK